MSDMDIVFAEENKARKREDAETIKQESGKADGELQNTMFMENLLLLLNLKSTTNLKTINHSLMAKPGCYQKAILFTIQMFFPLSLILAENKAAPPPLKT